MVNISLNAFDEEGGAQAPSDNLTVQRMMALANEIVETEMQIEAMEEALKELKGNNNRIKTIDMPDIMAECGMTSVRTVSGHTVEIQDFVQGSLTKDPEKRKVAIAWLSDNGAADLIKTEVSVEFGKTEHNEAKNLTESLREQGYPVQEQESIHAQSLLAYARERLRNGEEIPLEELGLFSGRTAKVKAPKVRK